MRRTRSIPLLLTALALAASGLAGCSRSIDEVRVDLATLEPLAPIEVAAADWPWWRGTARDNHATGPAPRTSSTGETGILWRADVPGRGHATPALWGGQLFVATADDQAGALSLVAFDRATGAEQWRRELHRGDLMRMHDKNSHASATPACDGKRVFMTFIADGRLWTVATDLAGEPVWKTECGPFRPRHGFGASPLIHGPLVIVAGDNLGPSYLAALHRKTGQLVWRTARGHGGSYATPVVANVAGRTQLLLSGQNAVTSYDPDTGQLLWTCRGPADTTAGTIAWSGELIFAGGGYPQHSLLAIRADGSGDVSETHIAWRKAIKAYVPSPLVVEDRLLVVRDDGVAICLTAASGDELWKKRLGGTFSASPLLVDDLVFVPNESGTMFVFRAGPTYEPVAENDLGAPCLASPVVAAGRLYQRTAGQILCIGEPDETGL